MAAESTFASTLDTSAGSPALAQSLSGLFRLPGFLGLWLRRAHVRRELARLDDRLLRDVGFDPAQARDEAGRPFWRPCALVRSLDR
ncbi:MAG TPA: DUF1127 domain-containing protein [Casimicrobiaceae bacterium]|nr:DUF1127 domain-containing protein [Casimicrobiaceae bacterium]